MTLKEMRIEAGLTQEEVAKAANTSTPNICNYEAGKYKPKYNVACRLANLFNCTVQDIMDGFEEGGVR